MKKKKYFTNTRGPGKGHYLEPIINPNGSFFCCACLRDHRKGRQSPDPRYCFSCFEYLNSEAALLNLEKAKPYWVPRPAAKPLPKPSNQKLGEKTSTPYPTRGLDTKKAKQLTLEGVL